MNKLKKFLRRVNRGLLLGGIVLAGFVVFVITDTISFKKNKPVIEDEIKSYVSMLEDVGVNKGSDQTSYKEGIDSLINKYWTFSDEKSDLFYYSLNQNEFKNILELNMNDSDPNAYVSKWTAKVNNIDISKAGPGYAMVSFDCQIVAEFSGNACIVNPCDAMTVNNYVYYGEKVPTGLSRISIDGYYKMLMTQKDGKWKICMAESYGWNSSEITAVDSEEGGNEE